MMILCVRSLQSCVRNLWRRAQQFCIVAAGIWTSAHSEEFGCSANPMCAAMCGLCAAYVQSMLAFCGLVSLTWRTLRAFCEFFVMRTIWEGYDSQVSVVAFWKFIVFGFDCFDWTRQLAPLLFAIPDLDCFAASVILSACCCDCSTGAPEVRLTHPFGHPIDHLCAASVSSLQLHCIFASCNLCTHRVLNALFELIWCFGLRSWPLTFQRSKVLRSCNSMCG